MIVSVNVPDRIAQELHLDGEQGSRRALEMLALEGYRAGELSRGQVSEMLDLELNETMGFLKEHGAFNSITVEEYRRSAEGLEKLLSR
jgi:predicted HTH domain antitoxin